MRGRASVYLVLTLVGAAVPIVGTALFIQWYGPDLGFVADQVWGQLAAKIVLLDLAISSIAFWVWLSAEAPRAGVRNWWLLVLANLLVGLCFALPLFLYIRERRRMAAPA